MKLVLAYSSDKATCQKYSLRPQAIYRVMSNTATEMNIFNHSINKRVKVPISSNFLVFGIAERSLPKYSEKKHIDVVSLYFYNKPIIPEDNLWPIVYVSDNGLHNLLNNNLLLPKDQIDTKKLLHIYTEYAVIYGSLLWMYADIAKDISLSIFAKPNLHFNKIRIGKTCVVTNSDEIYMIKDIQNKSYMLSKVPQNIYGYKDVTDYASLLTSKDINDGHRTANYYVERHSITKRLIPMSIKKTYDMFEMKNNIKLTFEI